MGCLTIQGPLLTFSSHNLKDLGPNPSPATWKRSAREGASFRQSEPEFPVLDSVLRSACTWLVSVTFPVRESEGVDWPHASSFSAWQFADRYFRTMQNKV
jgi:hypothetical protein